MDGEIAMYEVGGIPVLQTHFFYSPTRIPPLLIIMLKLKHVTCTHLVADPFHTGNRPLDFHPSLTNIAVPPDHPGWTDGRTKIALTKP